MTNLNNYYLGQGLSRNLVLTGRTDAEVVYGIENVKQSVITLFNTEAANSKGFGGERVMNRSVGLNLKKFLFLNDTPAVRELFKDELMKIPSFEPRIYIPRPDIQVYAPAAGSENDQHKWIVNLPFEVVPTGEEDNLIVGILAPDGFARILPRL